MLRNLFAVGIALLASVAHGGYEMPPFIDGGQSADGRFVVTAQRVSGDRNHGPNGWRFTWEDRQTKEQRTFEAKGVQGGQIYAQLFVAPDGETFALFNHLTLWTEGKSDMHGAKHFTGEQPGSPKSPDLDAFSRRIIIYRKDGSIVKEIAARDILRAAEWDNVVVVFNRFHWIQEYPGRAYKKAPRPAYALCNVSPDYTVLEVLVAPPRGAKGPDGKSKAGPRAVRISLVDGRIFGDDETISDEQKIPVRPFQGPDALPDNSPAVREGYRPSLDPVRQEGTLTVAPTPPAAS